MVLVLAAQMDLRHLTIMKTYAEKQSIDKKLEVSTL